MTREVRPAEAAMGVAAATLNANKNQVSFISDRMILVLARRPPALSSSQ